LEIGGVELDELFPQLKPPPKGREKFDFIGSGLVFCTQINDEITIDKNRS
jgi:hypothetical protein